MKLTNVIESITQMLDIAENSIWSSQTFFDWKGRGVTIVLNFFWHRRIALIT